MNFGGSVKVDAGASLKGVTDAAAKAKDAVKAAEDAASQAKSAVTGAVDAAKAQVDDAVNSAKDAVAGAVATAKATVSAAVAAAEEKAAAVKEQCLAAKEKFQNTVAPADGWKAAFATGTQISIGKSFGQTAGITLGNLGDFMLSDALSIVFEEDPESVDKQNDKFILFSTDEAKTYRQEKTVKDDLILNDKKLSLKFEGLNKELTYSMQIDPGDGIAPYFVFESKPFGEW